MCSFPSSFPFLAEIYLVWSCYTELGSYLTPQWLFMILLSNRRHNINNSKDESKEKQNTLCSGFSLSYHACVLHCLLPSVFCLWECDVNHKATAFQLSNSCAPPFSVFTKGYPLQFGYEKKSFSNIST